MPPLQAAKGPGDDVRAVGSDIKAGEIVLPEGTVIGAAEVGLLATVGAAKLRVGFLLHAVKSACSGFILQSLHHTPARGFIKRLSCNGHL